MGQKINPIIFRLGSTQNWKSKYISKKNTETKIYNFKDIEIRNFVNQFFKSNGISIHKLKLSYYNDSLQIFISCLPTVKSISLINTNNKIQKIKLVTKKINTSKYLKYDKIKKNIKNFIKYKKLNSLSIGNSNQKLIFDRIRFLKYYKNYLITKRYKQINNIRQNSFLTDFFLSLNQFTNNSLNISLVINRLDKDVKHELEQKKIKILKKNITKLRKYENNEFFKKGLGVLFLCVTQKNSAMLMANFIASQLKVLKRHNFFLRFIKNTLTLFHTKTFSKLKGIKIKVKGRFNRAPRARHKIIEIGNSTPTLTLKSKIDYFETTAFSANGTFGVKVWVCEKY